MAEKRSKLEQAKRLLIRTQSGLTPTELAEALGVDRVTAHRYLKQLGTNVENIGGGLYIYRPTLEDVEVAELILRHAQQSDADYLQERAMRPKRENFVERLNKIAHSIPYKYRSWTPYEVSWSDGEYCLAYPHEMNANARVVPIGKTARHAVLRLLAVRGSWADEESKLTTLERLEIEAKLFAKPPRDVLLSDIVGLHTLSVDELRRLSGFVTHTASELSRINLGVARALDAAMCRALYARDVTNFVAELRGVPALFSVDGSSEGVKLIERWCEEMGIVVGEIEALRRLHYPDPLRIYSAQELSGYYREAGLQHEVIQDDRGYWKKWYHSPEDREMFERATGGSEPIDDSFSHIGSDSYRAATVVLSEVNWVIAKGNVHPVVKGVPDWWCCETSEWALYLFDQLNEVPGPMVWESVDSLDDLEESLEFLTNIVSAPYFAEALWVMVSSLEGIVNWVCVERGDWEIVSGGKPDDDVVRRLDAMWNNLGDLFEIAAIEHEILAEDWNEDLLTQETKSVRGRSQHGLN